MGKSNSQQFAGSIRALEFLATGTIDPTVTAFDRVTDTLYYRHTVGSLYRKLDDGLTTNWELLLAGGGAPECNRFISGTRGAPNQVTALGGIILPNNTFCEMKFYMEGGEGAGPAPGTPAFGTARSYALLGAVAVTGSAGPGSTITGNLGESPGNTLNNFPPSTVSGSTDIANAAAAAAMASALASYTDLQARASTVIASALDGQTLAPGVYSFASGAATLANSAPGTLTLDGGGNPNAVFVIKTASTLTTGAGGAATIALVNGANAANVYWVIGSSATLNVGTPGVFNGNLIAQASVTVTNGGTTNGTLAALTGAITLTNTMSGNAVPLPVGPAAVVVTANPSISPGTFDGQLLFLVGRSAVATVTLNNGHGTSLNGQAIFGEDDTMILSWDTVNWVEVSRSF